MQNSEPKIYGCDGCKVLMEVICGDQKDFSCCGVPMQAITPDSAEGATEKHLPIIEKNGSNITVKVGSVFHPMSAEHSIEWVYLKTQKGCQRIDLKPNEEPIAKFVVAEGDHPIAVYSYCNLHGFWKTKVE